MWLCGAGISSEDVLDDLDEALNRIPMGDPAIDAHFKREGPKGMTTVDLDADGHLDLVVGNLDATITLLFGDGTGSFPTVKHLHTGGRSLRGVTVGTFTFDERPDIMAADPFVGVVFTFENLGSRSFGAGAHINT